MSDFIFLEGILWAVEHDGFDPDTSIDPATGKIYEEDSPIEIYSLDQVMDNKKILVYLLQEYRDDLVEAIKRDIEKKSTVKSIA